MECNNDQFLWVESYRPRKIDDCILPESIKSKFRDFVKKGQIPNMILSGGAGMGKTTIARAICEELGCDYIIINGSKDGNIDTLRTDIQSFASTMSIEGKPKIVILDEADGLNPKSFQPALRAFIEEFSKNCRFILTCNYKNRLIPPLHSRAPPIEFSIESADRPIMASQFFKRAMKILENEKVKADPKCVAKVIEKYFPDYRRILNELQKYSSDGVIDEGILSNLTDVDTKDLVSSLKEKDFKKMRQWVANNSDIDPGILYSTLDEVLMPIVTQPPQFILIIADYLHKSAFSANQEITLTACCTEIMASCEFK